MKKLLLGLVSTCLLTTGCISTTPMGTVGSERKQLMLIPESVASNIQEKRINKITNGIKHPIFASSEERLARIMNSLIPYADEYIKDGRELNWRVKVISHKYTNAGAVGKGMLIVTAKMADHPGLKDEHLAAILAHEMAHILRDHNREIDSWRYVGRPVTVGTAILATGGIASMSAIVHDLQSVTYSRVMEKEADRIGLDIMTKAGYHPDSSIEVFKLLEPVIKKERPILSKIPSILSSHPSFNSRVKRVEKNMDALTAQYVNHNPEILTTNSKRLIDLTQYDHHKSKIVYVKNNITSDETKSESALDSKKPILKDSTKVETIIKGNEPKSTDSQKNKETITSSIVERNANSQPI